MKQSKIARLRAAGWKVADAREFFGLSTDEVALIELKLGFAEFLREERQRCDLTQSALARSIGSSQSRVAKIEAGDASVSLDLMFRTAFSLGVSFRQLGQRIAKLQRTRRAG